MSDVGRSRAQIAVIGITVACGGGDTGATGPLTTPLAGLVPGATNSENSRRCNPPPNPTPGCFTVRSWVTARSAGSRDAVDASSHRRRPGDGFAHGQPTTSDTLGVGAQVASVTTDVKPVSNSHVARWPLHRDHRAAGGKQVSGDYVAAIAHAHSATIRGGSRSAEIAARSTRRGRRDHGRATDFCDAGETEKESSSNDLGSQMVANRVVHKEAFVWPIPRSAYSAKSVAVTRNAYGGGPMAAAFSRR